MKLNRKKNAAVFLLVLSSLGWAALPGGLRSAPPKLEKSPPWMLSEFLQLSRKDPDRLMRIAQKLYAPERMKTSESAPDLAFEWQHRLAAMNAITDFFEPSHPTRGALKGQARDLIQRAIMEDPSLLVRDGAIEAVRRIIRMDENEPRKFFPILQKAFFDRKNVIDGEGFFIRETILVTMREGSLPLTNKIRQAAAEDQNPAVRDRLSMWDTRVFTNFSGKKTRL